MFLHLSVILFTGGVCVGGHTCWREGMCGRGVCGRGHAWQGGCSWQGVCMVGAIHGRGMHGSGHAWRGTCSQPLKWTVHILLEYILVIVTTCQWSYEKVMFSVVSVCHSVCPQWDLHATITHDALDLTVQPPILALPQTSDPGHLLAPCS